MSLEYVAQHLDEYHYCYQDSIGDIDGVSPFDSLCKYITAFFGL